MSQIDPKNVSATETGITRVYQIDLPVDQVDLFQDVTANDNGTQTGPMAAALGATHLDTGFVDVFDVSQLEGVGLVNFLIDGNGIAADKIAPYRDLFDKIDGTVMVVYSQAFGGHAQTLSPKTPLRFLAAFQEDTPAVNFEPLPDGGTQGPVEDAAQKKRPSDAAMGGRVATVALLVMAALVWVMIKIAG